MFRQCCLLQGTRLNTIKEFVKLAHVSHCTHARVPHVIARASARVSKKWVIHVKSIQVLIKATRTHNPIFENRPHLLLLKVFLVGKACLIYNDCRVLQCMIGLVEVARYRKVIPPVYDISNLRPFSLMYTVAFGARQTIDHAVRDTGKMSGGVNMPWGWIHWYAE